MKFDKLNEDAIAKQDLECKSGMMIIYLKSMKNECIEVFVSLSVTTVEMLKEEVLLHLILIQQQVAY